MASSVSLLLLLLVAAAATTTITARPPPPTTATSTTSFIKSSCKSTLYPDLCLQSLAPHAASIGRSPRSLALAALSVALSRTREASDAVSRLSASSRAVSSRQAGAIRDCIETMADGVDRVRRSVEEMSHAGRANMPGYAFHMSNVQTWVSAALTDESTCLDGLRTAGVDPATRAAVRKEIVGVAHVTSNALALVNKLCAKH